MFPHLPVRLPGCLVPLLVVSLLGAAGCPSSDSGGEGGSWTVRGDASETGTPDSRTPDTHPDTSPAQPDTGSPDADTEMPSPDTSVTFRLVNRSDSAIEVVRPACRSHRADWRQLFADATHEKPTDGSGASAGNALLPVRFEHEECLSCTCSELENDESCGVACFACPAGRLETLHPGESISYQWNGVYYREERHDGRSCQRAMVPEQGVSLAAELCWVTTPNVESMSEIEDVECERKSFVREETEVVEHVVRKHPGPEPTPRTFRLTNDTPQTVYVRQPSSCTQTREDWLQLEHLLPNDAVDRKKIATDCTECTCADADDGGCAVCRAVCTEGELRQLDPGDSVEYRWSGWIYEKSESDGRTCYRREVPEPERLLRARFCHLEPQTADGSSTTPEFRPECGSKTVSHGESETIVHRVSSSPTR